METKEYRGFIDKSEWPRGPWHDEPDKVQWADPATGLPCLIVRGPHGSFCGYVGVPEAHPWHGKDYGQCTAPTCDRTDEHPWCDHTPEHLLESHGGITFAGGCADTSESEWRRTMAHLPTWESEAKRYPKGDAARRIRDLAPLKNDYAGWRARREAVAICHVPAPGDPDHIWWFGFDCAHSGDMSPAYDRVYGGDTYRDLEYVRAEVTSLAAQLACVTKEEGGD